MDKPTLISNSKKGNEFIGKYVDSVIRLEKEKEEWIKELREKGIKACHPNDGWVDRIDNKVHFAYPLFDDGVNIGDKIMLGFKKNCGEKLVRVVDIETTFLKYYYFEDVELPKSPKTGFFNKIKSFFK